MMTAILFVLFCAAVVVAGFLLKIALAVTVFKVIWRLPGALLRRYL